MSYQVKLEAFEGPLDLLLHLINRLEIDIYDIPMAELTAAVHRTPSSDACAATG